MDGINWAETITQSVQAAVNDVLDMFAAVLPIALTVFAVSWGVRKAIRFFKGATH